MTNHFVSTRFWRWGGLIGLLLPVGLFTIIQLLASSRIALGENNITALLVFILAILEIPPTMIGRTLNLPIETGEPAFIICNLTPFGCVFVMVFWTLLGVLIGKMFDKLLRSRS